MESEEERKKKKREGRWFGITLFLIGLVMGYANIVIAVYDPSPFVSGLSAFFTTCGIFLAVNGDAKWSYIFYGISTALMAAGYEKAGGILFVLTMIFS